MVKSFSSRLLMNGFLFALTLALPTAVLAWTEDQKVEMGLLGKKLNDCLNYWALMEGAATCHAPSEILPAVYAQCETEQNAINEYLRVTGNGDLVGVSIANLLRRRAGALTKIILDNQPQCK